MNWRSIIKRPFGFLMRPLGCLSCKILGYKKEITGNCSLSGSAEFLIKSRNALTKLIDYDLEMGSSILGIPWFIYASGRKPILSIDQKVCGISDGWLKSGELGIIAYMVYAQTKHRYKLERREPLLEQTEIAVADWLKQHQFPENLIKSFNSEK